MFDGAMAASPQPLTAAWVVTIEGAAQVETLGVAQTPEPGMTLNVGDVIVAGEDATIVVRLVDGGAVALGAGGRVVVGGKLPTEAGIPWPSVVVQEGPAALTGAPEAEDGSPLLMALVPEGTIEIVGGPVVLDDGTVRLGDPLGARPTEVHVVAGTDRVPITQTGAGFAFGFGSLAAASHPPLEPGVAALLAWLDAAYRDLDTPLAASFAGPLLDGLAPAAGADGPSLDELGTLLEALAPAAAPAVDPIEIAFGVPLDPDTALREVAVRVVAEPSTGAGLGVATTALEAAGLQLRVDAAAGTLVLSGTAPASRYEAVLRTLAYRSIDDGGHGGPCTVEIVVHGADGTTLQRGRREVRPAPELRRSGHAPNLRPKEITS